MMRPTFAVVFAEQWAQLPPALKAHYANRPFSKDRVVVEGVMEVEMAGWLKHLSPLIRWSRMLTPYEGKNVPATVQFDSEPDSNAFVFHRQFRFEQGEVVFHSRMIPTGAHEVIEYMNFGIGWRAGYAFDGQRVQMTHRGYVWKLMGRTFSLPRFIEPLIGRGMAWEEAVSEDEFIMRMELRSRWLGLLYAYGGRFRIAEVTLKDA
ncbi:MAG: DUF4166 domain-containing protein [Asticcacaulis sp.]